MTDFVDLIARLGTKNRMLGKCLNNQGYRSIIVTRRTLAAAKFENPFLEIDLICSRKLDDRKFTLYLILNLFPVKRNTKSIVSNVAKF